MLSFRLNSLICVCQNDDLTALQDIPAMQRRRLSALAKIALHTARTILAEQKVDYIVWTSACGDEVITAQIMNDIAQGETPSPTQFSVSVHNAISGLYSILYKDDTPAVSLSSALDSAWSDAMLEAYAFLKTNNAKHALIVYYDAPLPTLYQSSYEVAQMHAVGAIMSLDEPNCTMTAHEQTNTPTMSPLQFYEFWQGDKPCIFDVRWVFER